MRTLETIHELMSEALAKYTIVCELDEKNWSDQKEIEMLNLAFELDDSGITMFALLRGLYDRFLKDTKFSAKYVLDEFIQFTTTLRAIKELYGIVEDVSIVECIKEFETRILESARGYGKPPEDFLKLEEFIADKYSLASVRLSALRSMRDLQQFQFIQGEPSDKPLKVNRWVFEFWNINSLVEAMKSQKIPGVSLCLIRDPDEVMASYFVFAVSNGENITILTDREEGPHPLYWKMARKPERGMAARWDKNYFPYHLLNLKQNEKGDYYAVERTGLVKYNTEAIRLAPLGLLPPADFMWTTLVLDRINEDFGKKNKLLPQLAYTGEMIITPEVLVGSTGSLVRRKLYKPLELPSLKNDDVTRSTTAEQWGHNPTTFNDWAEERYASNVPAEILNVVGEKQRKLLSASTGLLQKEDHWNNKDESIKLVGFSPVTFGDTEKLHRDQLWVARYNQMQHINKQLNDEYEKNIKDVIAWWDKAINKQADRLVEAALRMVFVTKTVRYGSWASEPEEKLVNILRVGTKANWLDKDSARLGVWSRDFGNWACYLEHKDTETLLKANVYALFSPDNPIALAALAGVKVTDLPIWLQHWYLQEPYDGNCILDRIDPLDWVVKNPWRDHKFYVHIPFAKSNYHRARKQLGLSFHRFVDEK